MDYFLFPFPFNATWVWGLFFSEMFLSNCEILICFRYLEALVQWVEALLLVKKVLLSILVLVLLLCLDK